MSKKRRSKQSRVEPETDEKGRIIGPYYSPYKTPIGFLGTRPLGRRARVKGTGRREPLVLPAGRYRIGEDIEILRRTPDGKMTIAVRPELLRKTGQASSSASRKVNKRMPKNGDRKKGPSKQQNGKESIKSPHWNQKELDELGQALSDNLNRNVKRGERTP